MKKIILGIVFLCFQQSIAQQTNETKSEIDNFKISALPYYSYGKGIGMTSPDSLYQLNIRFRMQNRATFYEHDAKEETFDAQIRRLRLRFDGFVGNPHFKYALQLSFSPGDLGGAIHDGDNINIIRDAVVMYTPNKHWNFIFGQTKLPGNRQRVNSSGALQFTDRSINNAKFNIDRDFGFQAYYLNQKKDEFAYNIKTAISSGKGRNWSGESNNFALTGKIELYPFGNFKSNGEYFEGDLLREQSPKLMISAVAHKNYGAIKQRGQTGKALYEKRNIESYFIDAILKYNGWAAMGSFMKRATTNPLTTDGTKNSMVFAGHGFDYQVSYIFKNNYEIIGRYSNQKVEKELYNNNLPHSNQYSLGLTKYIWEHAFKIQGEVSYDQYTYKNQPNVNDIYVRFQIEIGI